MDWVLVPDELPQAPAIGVAVIVTDEATFQLHAGLICCDGERTTLLELRWNHWLCNEEVPQPGSFFLWARLNLPLPRINAIIGHARNVFERHPQIKYGLVYDGGAFIEEDGLLKLSGQRVGLTCATFILAVLQTAGLDLLDRRTWPVRAPEDARWRAQIIRLLSDHAQAGRYGVTWEHVRNVGNEPDAPRFRPEEVAGACADATAGSPVIFDAALRRGRGLLTGFLAAAVMRAMFGLE